MSSASAIAELNRAIAVAEVDGAEAGLAVVDRLDLDGTSTSTPRGPTCSAASAAETRRGRGYERALELPHTEPERRFLKRRLAEVSA